MKPIPLFQASSADSTPFAGQPAGTAATIKKIHSPPTLPTLARRARQTLGRWLLGARVAGSCAYEQPHGSFTRCSPS
jgi:hypothetical protein